MKTTLLSIAKGISAAALCVSMLPVSANTGGPDAFGYTYRDSYEADGPVYSWIDITTTGTLSLDMAFDDDYHGFPLSFAFDFYGTSMDSVYLGTNGTVYFEDTYLGLSNTCMPGTPGYTMTQYNFIAHLWDDLDPSSQGGVYTQDFGTYFVISFEDIVPCCGAGDGDSWQVILYDDGNILIQYEELSNVGTGGGATVGIQDSPTVGLEYLCNTTGNPLSSGLAILFIHPSALVSIDENEIIEPGTMSVYPNPAQDIAFVQYQGTHEVISIEVIDLTGRMVGEEAVNATGDNQFELGIARFAPGTYVIRLTTSVGIIQEKLIIR